MIEPHIKELVIKVLSDKWRHAVSCSDYNLAMMLGWVVEGARSDIFSHPEMMRLSIASADDDLAVIGELSDQVAARL